MPLARAEKALRALLVAIAAVAATPLSPAPVASAAVTSVPPLARFNYFAGSYYVHDEGLTILPDGAGEELLYGGGARADMNPQTFMDYVGIVQLQSFVSCGVTDGTLVVHVPAKQCPDGGAGNFTNNPRAKVKWFGSATATWTSYMGAREVRRAHVVVHLSSNDILTLTPDIDGPFCGQQMPASMNGYCGA